MGTTLSENRVGERRLWCRARENALFLAHEQLVQHGRLKGRLAKICSLRRST
jgi:hypothetical protein